MTQGRTTALSPEGQIARMLVEGGFLTEEQLQEALGLVRQQRQTLREVLAQKQWVNWETFTTFLSLHSRVPIVDLQQVQISQEALDLVPEEVARRYQVIPLALEGGDTLRVATDNPLDNEAISTLATVSGKRIKPRIPMRGNIRELLDRYYRAAPRMNTQLQELLGGVAPPAPTAAPQQPGQRPAPAPAAQARATPRLQLPAEVTAGEDVGQAPVVRAVTMLISQAVKDRASDIHLESAEDSLVVRYRIDGVMHEAVRLPMGVRSAVISRVKVLAGMDITERRRPQDGSFSLTVDDKAIDFRVASIETSYGEKVVMRILDKSTSLRSLDGLGFQPSTLQLFQGLLQSPWGMILVSGPTGSGKTTTLYAALNSLDTDTSNVMTIEDPIEYHFKGINQIQVNQQADITFAKGLRAIVRMDPDIIMVGEIRDSETAHIAIQAALTGHLVLSTVHANDSAAAITRLVDLGVEPFLVTAALVGSLAQRLVRRVCSYCKTITGVLPEEAAAYQSEMGEVRTDFYVGRGCNFCSRTGYQGRTGVYELMVVNDKIRDMVTRRAPTNEIRAEAIRFGMMSMRRDGMLKAKDGVTTPREILRNVFTLLN